MPDDHRHARVRAADQAVGRRNRREDVVRFQRVVTEVIQLTGENIEEDFGIRGGIDMAAFSSNSFYAARAHWSGCRYAPM